MAWTTPGTATAGEVLTAAFWNTNVRDNSNELAPFFSGWTSWTPQIDQGASTNIAKTVHRAKYLQIGKMVMFNMTLNVTGTGTGGLAITVTLPVPAAFNNAQYEPLGNAFIYDASAAALYGYFGAGNLSGKMQFIHQVGGQVGSLPSFALANGDQIYASGHYEAA